MFETYIIKYIWITIGDIRLFIHRAYAGITRWMKKTVSKNIIKKGRFQR